MKLSSRSEATLSAALRHIRDAESLGDPRSTYSSLDQAYHLAGFGPECARKATLSTGQFDKVLGHDFGATSDLVLDSIEALDPEARRYIPRNWSQIFPTLTLWKPDSRYHRTGTYSEAQVACLLAESRAAVDGIVFKLWIDGVLEELE